MTYLNMLEEEMAASDLFTKENFGLQVGDSFPEMVREVLNSEKVAGKLLIGLLMGSFSGKELAESMRQIPDGEKPNIGKIILKHVGAFDTPLAMLYWGIQIGRRMERESAKSLTQLEQF